MSSTDRNGMRKKNKKKLCCLFHCCHFAVVVKQPCDLCKKGRTVSSVTQYWLLCVLWCGRAAITGGEWRHAGGEGGGQQRDVLYILVYSQQLHLGEQEDPDCLHTQTCEFFSTRPPNRNVWWFTVTSYISIASSLHICYESVLWCEAKEHSATGSSLTQGYGFG